MDPIRRVGVIGAGVMGAGIAAQVANAGIPVVLLDIVHPPAVSTALSFAFQGKNGRTLLLFTFALAMIAVLVLLQRGVLWLFKRLHTQR